MFQPLVTVAGVPFPEPAIDGYKAYTATIVDQARNADGRVIGAVIRYNVAKIEENWSFLTLDQWADMLALFDNERGGNFVNPVLFLNQDTGKYETRDMYVSDRNARAYLRDSKTKELRGWTNLRLALIEV